MFDTEICSLLENLRNSLNVIYWLHCWIFIVEFQHFFDHLPIDQALCETPCDFWFLLLMTDTVLLITVFILHNTLLIFSINVMQFHQFITLHWGYHCYYLIITVIKQIIFFSIFEESQAKAGKSWCKVALRQTFK